MPNRIAEIRARLDAATPGPWGILHHDLCCGESWVRDESGYHVGTSLYSNDEKRDENLSLIAHAPADIAWLLAEVERLERENAYDLLEITRKASDAEDSWMQEAKRLAAEVERLRDRYEVMRHVASRTVQP